MRVFLAGLLAVCLSAQAAAQSPAGLWEGSIAAPGTPLKIVVRLEQAGDSGPWSGTIDIPAQGVKNIRLAEVTVDRSTVRFVLGGLPGTPTFVGGLSADGSEIAGRFTQAKTQLAFTLTRNESGVVSRPPRPQEPRPPLPYETEDVTLTSAAAVRLTGTVTRPREAGRHPAVVLVSGSGAQDRDNTVSDHKTFLVLADHLTRRGVVVLRVDDRGTGGSTASTAAATPDDLAADVQAGLELLRTRADVDPAGLGLVGHGEGGLIASIVATRKSDVRFLVLLGTSGLPGEQVMLDQVDRLARAMKIPEERIAKSRVMQQQMYEIVRTEPNVTVMRSRIAAMNGEAAARLVTSPWFRFFLQHDPSVVLRTIKISTLALVGENDIQVVAKSNLAAIESALKAAGNTDVTARALPRLNHLFQTSTTGLPTEYGQIEETFAPDTLTLISDWILQRRP